MDLDIPTQPSYGLEDLPIHIFEVELSEPFMAAQDADSSVAGKYKRGRALIRLHHIPLGYVTLPSASLSSEELAEAIWAQLQGPINAHLQDDGFDPIDKLTCDGVGWTAAEEKTPRCQSTIPADAELPLISVVVCTRNRPQGARVTLRGLVDLQYPNFEVVIVDNAPSNDDTHDVVVKEFGEDARVRYVRELRPGLSCARNRGLAEAKGEIVAFTDDDVEVDQWWLKGLVKGFKQAENVGLVTGFVPSAQLDTPYQLYFDQRLDWGSSCRPRMFDLVDNRDDSPVYPYSAGVFGTGANFAITKSVIDKIGSFDEALGAGTLSRGGEDLDIFLRAVVAGFGLAYEPSAMVRHVHRSDAAAMQKQMFAYGCGFTAYLVKRLLDPKTAFDLVRRIPRSLIRFRRAMDDVGQINVLPKSIIRRELFGMLMGPFYYARSRQSIPKKPIER